MNKFLNIIKIILLLLLIYFNIKYFVTYKVYNVTINISIEEVLYIIYFIIFSTIVIYDSIKYRKINNNIKYNILTCIILLVMMLIFIRCFYDPGFITNSIYMSNINDYINTYESYPLILEVNKYYIVQNIPYFVLLTILLLIYRFINKKNV